MVREGGVRTQDSWEATPGMWMLPGWRSAGSRGEGKSFIQS